jgi:hypothetical protein
MVKCDGIKIGYSRHPTIMKGMSSTISRRMDIANPYENGRWRHPPRWVWNTQVLTMANFRHPVCPGSIILVFYIFIYIYIDRYYLIIFWKYMLYTYILFWSNVEQKLAASTQKKNAKASTTSTGFRSPAPTFGMKRPIRCKVFGFVYNRFWLVLEGASLKIPR